MNLNKTVKKTRKNRRIRSNPLKDITDDYKDNY